MRLTAEQVEKNRTFFRTWTKNGKYLIQRMMDSNFFMRNRDRNHCTKIEPAALKQLIKVGILEAVAGGWRFVGKHQPIAPPSPMTTSATPAATERIGQDIYDATAIIRANAEDGEQPADPNEFEIPHAFDSCTACGRENVECVCATREPASDVTVTAENPAVQVEPANVARSLMLTEAAEAVMDCEKLRAYIVVNSLSGRDIVAVLDKAAGKRGVTPASAIAYFKGLAKKGGASGAAAA